MTLQPFCVEEAVTVGEETYRLVLDFQMIDATEALTERPFDEIVGELYRMDRVPAYGTIGRVIWGLLRRHHPEITLEQAASLAFGETGTQMGIVIGKLISRAFPIAEPKAKAKNPPKRRRGTSRPS